MGCGVVLGNTVLISFFVAPEILKRKTKSHILSCLLRSYRSPVGFSLSNSDSSFVQEEKENSAEVEPSLKSLKENTEKAAETEELIQVEKEMLTNEHKTDSRENIRSEGSKSSNLDVRLIFNAGTLFLRI